MKTAMVLCVIGALLGMKFYNFHVYFSLGYMGLVSLWDLSILKGSAPLNDEKVLEHEKFKKCCKQLLWHVDGVVFIVVLVWLIVIKLFIVDDHRTFSFVSEVTAFLKAFPDKATENISQLSRHNLEEPLMGGMIGFHTILSMALLVVHFSDWEADGNDAAAVAPVGNQAPVEQT
jgi:hypothetical protein